MGVFISVVFCIEILVGKQWDPVLTLGSVACKSRVIIVIDEIPSSGHGAMTFI